MESPESLDQEDHLVTVDFQVYLEIWDWQDLKASKERLVKLDHLVPMELLAHEDHEDPKDHLESSEHRVPQGTPEFQVSKDSKG